MSAELLWIRRCSVAFGPRKAEAELTVFDGLSVSFDVEKDNGKDPNKASITVYNLSKATRDALQQGKNFIVVLKVAYGTKSELALLFKGDIRKVSSERKGATWETKIEAGDGEKALTENTVSMTFKAGTTGKQQAENVIKSAMTDLAIGTMKGIKDFSLKKGKTVEGVASDVVNKIAGDSGAEFSVQDEEVQIVDVDLDTGEEAVSVRSDTGLIGSPAFVSREKPVKGADGKIHKGADGKAIKKKVDGIEFKSLLNVGLRPGRAAHVVSEHFDGFFKINKVKHSGETNGNNWYSSCEATPLEK